MSTITPRQREALQLAAGGYKIAQIAIIMNVSHRTVWHHMQAIHQAYGTSGHHTAAVVEGIRRGDVDLAAAYANIVEIKKANR